MQIKIILSICAVLMTVLVIATAILDEPSQMIAQSAALEARQL